MAPHSRTDANWTIPSALTAWELDGCAAKTANAAAAMVVRRAGSRRMGGRIDYLVGMPCINVWYPVVISQLLAWRITIPMACGNTVTPSDARAADGSSTTVFKRPKIVR